MEIKERVFVVTIHSICPYYLFSDGKLMPCFNYDNRSWEMSCYSKEYFYVSLIIGDDYFIESQEKVVKTIPEAKQYQKEQTLKLINKKEQEIIKLKRGMLEL